TALPAMTRRARALQASLLPAWARVARGSARDDRTTPTQRRRLLPASPVAARELASARARDRIAARRPARPLARSFVKPRALRRPRPYAAVRATRCRSGNPPATAA